MSKTKIYLLMAAVSLLLILLVSIQVFWINNARRVEARQMKAQVQHALKSVEGEIRNANTCVDFFTKVYMNPGEGFYVLKQSWDDTGYKGIADTVHIFYDYSEYELKHGKPQREIPYNYLGFKTNDAAYAEISMKVIYKFEDTVGFNTEKDTVFDGLDRYNFKQRIAGNQAIFELYDMAVIDSMIKSCLTNEHISSPYGFAFIDKNNNTEYASRIEDSTMLLPSPYSTVLFAEDNFIKPYTLSLVFNNSPELPAINLWLWISVGIIIILTASFYAFVRLYLQQTKLSEMKSDFIHNLTHEFNTPMANISLAIETLEEEGRLTPEMERVLDILAAESGRLKENIEQALQVASMEKGTLPMRKEPVDVVAIVNAVISSYQLQCEQLGGQIEYSYPNTAIVQCDETHILNCICNLLDNAIKYRKGAPAININIEEKDKKIHIIVADKGKGMTGETMKHIFDKFYRAHEGDLHTTKGFGLGLAYVKTIVEAHEGKVLASSKLGVGSQFIIQLPKSGYHGARNL